MLHGAPRFVIDQNNRTPTYPLLGHRVSCCFVQCSDSIVIVLWWPASTHAAAYPRPTNTIDRAMSSTSHTKRLTHLIIAMLATPFVAATIGLSVLTTLHTTSMADKMRWLFSFPVCATLLALLLCFVVALKPTSTKNVTRK